MRILSPVDNTPHNAGVCEATQFRHCFATHLYEEGHNLLALKKLLGHVRIDTTAWYTQLAYSQVLGMKSPIETLPKKKGRPRKVNADA